MTTKTTTATQHRETLGGEETQHRVLLGDEARRSAALDLVVPHLELYMELTAAEIRTIDRDMRRMIAARKAQGK